MNPVPSPNDSMTAVFAGGGTGGHLYPALAVADALQRRVPNVRCVFFGTDKPIDQRILTGTGHDLVRQSLPPFERAPWRWPKMLLEYRQATRDCRAHFSDQCPWVVVGTGSISSVPAMREAQRAGLLTVLLNPDATPGRANRHLAPSADAVFVQWSESVEHFPAREKVHVVGCPIRPQFHRATREQGVKRFGLDPDRKTLLVTGASQGARTVNEAVLANLDFLDEASGWQVLHLTGELDFGRVQKAYEGRRIPSRIVRFTRHMAQAIAASDLVVSRAGASTLAELAAAGRPSILMPYPYHKDMHQLANARCLVRRMAARIVPDAIDAAVNGPALREALEPLMFDDEKRGAMGQAASRAGQAQAADEIADHILAMARARDEIGERETVEA